jgi:prophage regulatory protein
MNNIKIIRWKELHTKIGMSRSTIDRWIKVGNFPPKIKLSKNSIGWLLSDVDAWLEKIRLVGDYKDESI